MRRHRLDGDPGDDQQQRDRVDVGGEHRKPVIAVGPLRVDGALRHQHGDAREPERGRIGQHVTGIGEQRQRAGDHAADDLHHHEPAREPQGAQQPALIVRMRRGGTLRVARMACRVVPMVAVVAVASLNTVTHLHVLYNTGEMNPTAQSDPARLAALDDDRVIQLAEMFRLMGDPTRLRIILSCLPGSIAVGDIAARLGLSSSLVSHHLRLLRAARVMRGQRHGKQVHYGVADEHISRVFLDMLDHVVEPEDHDVS